MNHFMSNVAMGAGSGAVVLDILQDAHVAKLIGASVYVGYGVDAEEMVAVQRYRAVMTVTSAP